MFMVVVTFLLIVPLYAAPYDTGMGLLCVVSGIPVYLIGVAWKNKPKVFNDYMGVYFFSRLFSDFLTESQNFGLCFNLPKNN